MAGNYLDNDCLIVIFEHLALPEKLKCRMVCKQWQISVDKLIAGQPYLEIYAVNSTLAAAAAEATGIVPYSAVGNYYSLFPVGSTINCLKQFWSAINSKLLLTTPAEPDNPANPLDAPPLVLLDPADPSLAAMNSTSSNDHLLSVCSPSSLIHLSTYYWTYAFCASSSLFSSYSFANSTITSHEYFHSFCDCYPRQRHKFSIILDRQRLSFEIFNNLFTKFSNIQSLVIRNIDQLSDVLIFMITHQCPNIQSLTFTNSSGLAEDANNQYSSLNCLTNYGWKLLCNAYPNLTSLTLRQCKLNEDQLTKVIKYCGNLSFLDISDNLFIGKSVRHLGPSIECLICGDLSNDESIDTILANIAYGNGRHLKYLSIFGALGSLKAFREFRYLSKLEIHFYTDEELSNYLVDIGKLSLTSLVLEQIRCYESPSAINTTQFEAMISKSPDLRRLQITGDFDWNLRLNDESLHILVKSCPRLQELTLNGNGSLTDYGIINLSNLPLVQLSLSSFHAITDYSIKTLLKKMSTLQQVTLVDMPQITDRVVSKAINVCSVDEKRKIKITLSDEQMSRRVKRRHKTYPVNLSVNFDSHLCGKQLADTEPTDVQMVLVILMSAVILGMTLLTTVVVVLVPLSMLLMMAHEYLFDVLFSHLDLFEMGSKLFSSTESSLTSSVSYCDTIGYGAIAISHIKRFIVSFAK